MHLFGRTFTDAIIARIQAAAAEPGVTRSALSRQVCGWLEWFGADGCVFHAHSATDSTGIRPLIPR